MMQAMLTAFITMNMSNSGIPSTKANSISRTFPPLFTIKISEDTMEHPSSRCRFSNELTKNFRILQLFQWY